MAAQTGADPLTGSPSKVEREQLDEVGLDVSAAVQAEWAAEDAD